jgi:hypothetical protein
MNRLTKGNTVLVAGDRLNDVDSRNAPHNELLGTRYRGSHHLRAERSAYGLGWVCLLTVFPAVSIGERSPVRCEPPCK